MLLIPVKHPERLYSLRERQPRLSGHSKPEMHFKNHVAPALEQVAF